MSNIEKHRAFIESLEGEKGLPEEMHGWHFDGDIGEQLKHSRRIGDTSGDFIAYLIERLRRAESGQIPDLKEQVKELVLDAMDATDRYWHKPRADDDREMEQFRALCAEVKP